MANQFLVSVAEVVLRDSSTHQAIAHGTTNVMTSLTQTMAKTDVRGGINNALLYAYFHDRAINFKIEMATFNEYVLALNNGATILNGSVTVVATDCVVLASGSGVLSKTPTSNVTVFFDNGASQLVTAIGKNIYISGGASSKVDCVYEYSTTADQITAGATTPPSIVDLTLTAEVRDASHSTVVTYFQLNVPQFAVSGNYTLSLNANAVSNQTLDGEALVTFSSDCTTGNYYYKATFIDNTGTSTPVTWIAANPDPMSISIAAGLPTTRQISVSGYRGQLYGVLPVTTSSSYVKTTGTSGSQNISVSATGLVTAGSATGSGVNVWITATYYDPTSGSLSDTVSVVTTA